MKLTKLSKGNRYYYVEDGKKVYGAGAIKLAMYENIADNPDEFGRLIRTAQEIMDGTAFSPKQAKQVNIAVVSQVEKAADAVLTGIIAELEKEYPDAAKYLTEHYKAEEEQKQ